MSFEDHKFKPGREKTGGRKKGTRDKITSLVLSEALKSGREGLPDAMKILAKDDPKEYVKFYIDLLKLDPSLRSELGSPGPISISFSWAQPEQRKIYLKADGSEWEKDWQGNLIPAVKALPSPDTAPIINYAKTLGQDPQ